MGTLRGSLTLGELCKFQAGSVFPLAEQGEVGGDIPFVKVSDMNSEANSYRFLSASNWITEETSTRLKVKTVPPGATIFAKIGEALKAERLRLAAVPTAIDNNMMAAIPREGVEPLFLRYLLENLRIAQWAQGSALPFLRSGDLEKIPVEVPNLMEQRRIANVISVIDEKIESVRKISRMAQMLAESIFEFTFETPTGSDEKSSEFWPSVRLGDILQQKRESTKPGIDSNLPYVPIDLIKTKSLSITEHRPNEEAKSSLIKFEENDILMGAMRVYFHRVAIAPFSGLTRTTTFVLRPTKPQYLEFALFVCNLERTIEYANRTSKGTTMPYAVWDGGLADLEIRLPPESLLKEFTENVKPLVDLVKNSGSLLASLLEIRKTVLPALFNSRLSAGQD